MVSSPGSRASDRRWRPLQVSPALAGRDTVTVELHTAVPAGMSGDHAWAIWGDPEIARRRPGPEIARALRRATATTLRSGPRAAVRELWTSALLDESTSAYRRWFEAHAPDANAITAMTADAARLPYRPLISLITPVYNTDPRWLRACIASVQAQVYDNWELYLSDDASTSTATRAVLGERFDSRIRVIRLAANEGISGASNAALALARGEFIALLDHDDELTPDALYRVVSFLNEHRDVDVIYSDEDKRDADGGLSDPFFKPCWSPEHLLSAAYTCHLTVARKVVVDRIGGFRKGFEGSQDHDLTLRLADQTSRIAHIPHVLYHWRRTPQSTATSSAAKPWAADAGKRALEDYLARHAIGGDVLSGGVPGLYRVRFAIVGEPRVSIVLEPAEYRVGPDALRAATRYANIEFVETAADARGDHLLFLDGGLRPLDDEWLTALLEYSQQEAIGAVGARLTYADGRLRHIGIAICLDAGPAAAFDGHAANSYGYFSSAIGVRNYAALSGECLMTRRAVFERLGGFNPQLPRFGADVDYCTRVRAAGLRVVFTPYARLQYTASASARQWSGGADDPYYNPNLSRTAAYEIDETSRVGTSERLRRQDGDCTDLAAH
jgi:GT2 family glycosyltransferase